MMFVTRHAFALISSPHKILDLAQVNTNHGTTYLRNWINDIADVDVYYVLW